MTSDAISRLRAALERGAAVRPKVGGFPHLAESLRQAGVTHCRMAVPANAFLYLTEHGDVVVQGEPLVTGFAPARPFDQAALIEALRADQAGGTTFPEFVRGCWEAGVVRYDVDTAARTCTYHGTDGDAYVEEYPAISLP
ncbi:DUF1398 domain-containing protein [Streptomyces sp. SID486]|uniref:DUF1398 family protein n=1 Tax=Streptomyces sp. SID486 TaxID=2690264 RepID=UPI00136B616C|nr:DUF1398 family protein [Streptomyces sp. SID486]MYX94761.1 DUF1398 domain-containing protein [Streptomyces sp. SID486]